MIAVAPIKKKAPIILSNKFPANNPEAGKETHFREKINSGEKIHTIRGNIKWWMEKAEKINSGEMALHLRSWTGQPYNSKQEEWAVYGKIGIQQITMMYSQEDGEYIALIDEKRIPIAEIAKNDGLTVEQFENWFFNSKHDPFFQDFYGVIIHFTDFRY